MLRGLGLALKLRLLARVSLKLSTWKFGPWAGTRHVTSIVVLVTIAEDLWWKAIINLRPHKQNFNFPLIACYNPLSAVMCLDALRRLPTPLPDTLLE